MSRDEVFANKREINDFKFDNEVANVFDDMLERSVPFYSEIQRMIGELIRKFYLENSNIYDLGCSTGTTMLNILKNNYSKSINVIGIDYSKDMVEKAKRKIGENYKKNNYEFLIADLNNKIKITNASVVILNLTLQFVRPINRDLLIKNIYNNLINNGCIIIIEKILGSHNYTNKMFIDYYYEFKRKKGYSELEISQKREALENVLIPFTIDDNKTLLKNNGFNIIDSFFQWYNFSGIIGIKEDK